MLKSSPAQFLATAAVYFGFGFLLEKGRVYVPSAIQGQFLFNEWTMMKMFMSALTTSWVVLAVFDKHPAVLAIRRSTLARQQGKSKQAVVLGSALLGTGMALAGTCPGTIFSQLGAGVSMASWVLFGALTGAFVYSLVQAPLKRAFPCRVTPGAASSSASVKPQARLLKVAAPLMPVMVAVLYNVEPYKQHQQSWPAFIAGTGIGLLQIPSIFLLGSLLGSSTNLVAFLAPLNHVPLVRRLIPAGSELSAFKLTTWSTWLRLAAAFGAIAGAYVSATMSGTFRGNGASTSQVDAVTDFHKLQAFLGGVALLFGARLAGGCTSGHGISGFACSMTNSVIAVPVMFASAITVSQFFL